MKYPLQPVYASDVAIHAVFSLRVFIAIVETLLITFTRQPQKNANVEIQTKEKIYATMRRET